MIYLAVDNNERLQRFQVFKLNSKWGSLNIDGTEEIVPFTHDTHDSVVNVLRNQYKNLELSKRIVDAQSHHIVCINHTYAFLDDDGDLISFAGTNRIRFVRLDSTDVIEEQTTCMPEHYRNIRMHYDNLFCSAQDIDTLKWFCLLKDGTIIATSSDRKEALTLAIQSFS